jgi:hypothetical protein
MTDITMRPAVDVGRRAPTTAAPAVTTTARRSLLLTGPVGVVAYVVGSAIAGEAPATDSSAAELTAYWREDAVVVASFVALAAAMLIGAFGAALASVLRDHGDDGAFPRVTTVGAALAAAGLALSATLALALNTAATDVGPDAVASLNPVFDAGFMPIVGGLGLLLAGAGLSARRTGALPAALAWPAIVLGVAAPLAFAGFATFVLGGLWIVVVAIVLLRRG